jgi:outer membrane pore protein F
MKKTLLAVAIPALLASGAASATTLYDNNGTKVDIKGQFRIALEYNDNRDQPGEDGTKIRDLGSRFGFMVKHDLGDGLYGLGEFEWGNATQSQEKDFELRNRKAYVGMGLDGVGEVTMGRVLSPFDDVAMSDYSYDYGGILDFGHGINNGAQDNFIGRVSNTVKFMSADFSGFSFGGTYTLQSDDTWSTLGYEHSMEMRNAYTLSGFYDSGFGLKLNAGYGHAKANGGAVTPTPPALAYNLDKYEADIWGVSAEYTIDAFSIALDVGQAQTKEERTTAGVSSSEKKKTDLYGLGAKYNLGKANVYGGYYFGDGNSKADVKEKHLIVVGTDYQFTPSVRTYIEYANTDYKHQNGASDATKAKYKDGNKAMIGMRVYF